LLDDDPKAKKPAKGKVQVEEAKPTHSKAWLDLTPLMFPGATETEQRCLLETVVPEVEGGEEPVAEVNGKLFEEAQSYIHLKFAIDTALNPSIDPSLAPSSAKIAEDFQEVGGFPSTSDTIKELQRQTQIIIKEIGLEYTRTFSEEGDHKDSPRGKQATTILSASQLRDVRDKKKEKFIIEFNKSVKYRQLRDRLRKAVMRLAVEKFKKTVGSNGVTSQQRDAFKA